MYKHQATIQHIKNSSFKSDVSPYLHFGGFDVVVERAWVIAIAALGNDELVDLTTIRDFFIAVHPVELASHEPSLSIITHSIVSVWR